MVMKIAFIQTGRTIDRNLLAVIDDYTSRIRKYCPFEIVTIPEIKNTRNMPFDEQKKKEGKKILESMNNDDYVILLDEHGVELRTRAFSEMMEKFFMLPKKRILFITGGAWGFSEEVYKRADMKMSLSKMTFPHQLVRLLFLEQLYRAFTIMKGEPYHHE
jgi:23S rRNA (pseudouridine1915-N3)-methyltransferase